jgi:uncharacterized repeat protein (TIGR01451 family)
MKEAAVMGTWSRLRIACVLVFIGGLLILAGGVYPSRASAGTLTVAGGITLTYPDDWSIAPPPYANVQELINVPAGAQATLSAADAKASAHILVSTELRLSHAEAVSRLKELVSDSTAAPTFLAICGWPALQRRSMVTQPGPGESDDARSDEQEVLLRLVTAVAVDSLIVRIEGSLVPNSPTAVADQVEAIARGMVCSTQGDPAQVDSELNELRGNSSSQSRQSFLDRAYHVAASLFSSSPAYAALPPRQLSIATEMEVAVSSDGQDIVVCGQNTYRTSNDGGVTFPFGGTFPLTLDGDCSLAVGRSGNFYNANLVNGSGTGVLFDRSTDRGQTFTNLSRADQCPDANNCSPDQEHIAADRVTAGTGGADQIYVVWRNFNNTGQDPALVCSQDGGMNWTNPPIDVEVGGFVPRITVGQDGFVYVIYRLGGNIRISKFSSCANGLAVQAGFPRTVTAVTDVTCPAVPGLDRCNDGNILSSHMAAVDDTNANHIYVAYATNTVSGTNENVQVIDSTDGGTMWGSSVPINTLTTGRRFMPWICALGGVARVSWYDRRAAVGGATNDLTDYFCGSASRGGGGLTAGTETKVTDSPDPECAAGAMSGSGSSWPCTVRHPRDSESCSVQPQRAGRCSPGMAPQTACDLSDCGVCFSGTCVGTATACTTDADCTRSPSCDCTAMQNCTFGGGCPKYGDYNGNACGLGRVYTAWASATAPSGQSPPGGITVYFNAKLTGTGPDLSVTKSGAPNPVVAGTDLTYTITVTNNSAIPALNVTMNDTVPANTTFQSVSAPAGFVCTTPPVGGTGMVSCTRNFTAANDVSVITLVVRVNANTPNGTILSNTAKVSSADPDPNTGNDMATATTSVITQADLAITKTDFPDPVLPAAKLHYIVSVTNNGPSDAQNVQIVQGLPLETTFMSLSVPSGWTCTTPPPGSNGTVMCSTTTLPAGATVDFVIVLFVTPQLTAGRPIFCKVDVSSSTTDPNPQNNTATATTDPFLPIPAAGQFGVVTVALALLGIGARSLLRRTRERSI